MKPTSPPTVYDLVTPRGLACFGIVPLQLKVRIVGVKRHMPQVWSSVVGGTVLLLVLERLVVCLKMCLLDLFFFFLSFSQELCRLTVCFCEVVAVGAF